MLGAHMTSSLCVSREREKKEGGREGQSSNVSSYKDTILSPQSPILMTSFNVNFFLRPYLQIQPHWDSGLQYLKFRNTDTFSP